MGDLLLGIPLLRRLRIREPNAKLVLYCRKGLGDFLLKSELVDDLIEVDKGSRKSRKGSEQLLRAREWDWVVCPHQSFRSHRLVGTLKAKRKSGYKKWWNGRIFNDRVVRPVGLPEALRQLALVQASDTAVRDGLGRYARHPDFRAFPELASLDSRHLGEVPEWASMGVPKLLEVHAARAQSRTVNKLSEKVADLARRNDLCEKRGSGLVFLAPGSVWNTKMWTIEGYIETAREFTKMGFRVAVIGAAAEIPLAEKISAEVPQAMNFCGGTSLYESTELLALGDLLVCNDSGAMHMASAAGVPSVAVFGPTTLALGYRPWQTESRIVQKNMRCRPCGTHGARKCPIKTHACMTSIAASDVMHEAGELLKRK